MAKSHADPQKSYPKTGTFEQAAPCPDSHPVRVPQLFYEVIDDTAPFNDPELWPENGYQPFVNSFGDSTGFANHGDYVFGWKDHSLQKIMNEACFVNCTSMRKQMLVVSTGRLLRILETRTVGRGNSETHYLLT